MRTTTARLREELAVLRARVAALEGERDALAARLAAVAEYEALPEPKVFHCWRGERHGEHDISPVALRTNRVEWESDLAERERMIELTGPAADRARMQALAEAREAAQERAWRRDREAKAGRLANAAHFARVQADHLGPWGRGQRGETTDG